MPIAIGAGVPVEQLQRVLPERDQASEKIHGKEFSERITNFIKDVDHAQKTSDAKVTAVAEGRDNDLHGTMIAMEQANIQLRLMATIRNKAIEAYREVMRMGA